MAEERIIRARLIFEADPQSAARANTATDQLRGRLKQLEQQAESTRRRMQALRQDAERLASISRNVGLLGAAITAPLIAAAQRYATTTGQTERASRRWLAALRDIEGANLRIGRVAANQLLPVLEKAASVAERLAAFAERNPEAVKAALGIGGGLVALGTLGALAAQGIKLYADFQLLTAASTQATAAALMNAAADKMLLAAGGSLGAGGAAGRAAGGAGLLVAAPLAAAAVGAAAGTASPENVSVTNRGFIPFDFNIPPVTAGGSSGPISGRTPEEWAALYAGGGRDRSRAAARYALQQAGLRAAARTAGAEAFGTTQGQLNALEAETADRRAALIADFRERATQLEAGYHEDRARLIADFEQSEARRLEDFQEARALAARDFAQREARLEEDYYAQRLRRARDFGADTARFEEDHQREQRYAAEDHSDRLRDLAAGRDALGFVKEQRAYEKERRRREEEHQIEAARRSADFAQDLADAEAAFAESREQRLADYEQQLADEQAQYDKESKRREEDQAARLRDLDDQYRKEKSKLQAHLTQQQKQLEDQYTKEKNRLKAHLRDQFTQLSEGLGDVYDLFGDFIDALEGTMTPGTDPWNPPPNPDGGDTPMAAGGYAFAGRYRMGERGREFVLNAMSTRAAERALGGMLSQERILSGLSGGGGGAGLSLSFAFHGSLSESDRRELTAWVERKVVGVVTTAVRRARTGRGP